MTRLALLPVLALVAGCSPSEEAADPGPVTQQEAEALEDAASMLDEQRLTDQTTPPDVPEGESE